MEICLQWSKWISPHFILSTIAAGLIFHNLVKNDEIQDKLIAEIDEALEESDGKITYDMIEGLKYMHMVFQESFR